MRLSKRLEACVSFTDGFLNLADIGTDHAQLPIAAVKRGYVMTAQAIDNKEGPYVMAFANVKKQGLEDKITVTLGDGIEKITDETDVVVIAGMGGELIAKILTKHPTRNVKRFILQANNHAESIRMILPSIGYKIIDEIVLEDQQKIYDIIIIEKGECAYTKDEITFGPFNLKYKPHFFIKKLNHEIIQLEYVLSQVKDENDKQKIQAKLDKIKEIIL